MSKTDLILEALFTGADEEEVKRRDTEAPKIIRDEWIEEFLKRRDIKKNSDGSYDVDGDVDLEQLKLQNLPVKFNKVSGGFWCAYGELTSLEGAPKIVGEDFLCHYNNLTDLKGAPATIGKDFWCHYNYLTSLEGAPSTVGGDVWCHNNEKKFTEKEVRAISKIEGGIYV